MNKKEYKKIIIDEAEPIDVFDKVKDYAYQKEYHIEKKDKRILTSWIQKCTALVSLVLAAVLIIGIVQRSQLETSSIGSNGIEGSVIDSQNGVRPDDSQFETNSKEENTPGEVVTDSFLFEGSLDSVESTAKIALQYLNEAEVLSIYNLVMQNYSYEDILKSIKNEELSSEDISNREKEVKIVYDYYLEIKNNK